MSLTICIKCDVLNALHDSTSHGIMEKMVNMKLKSAYCAVLGNVVYVRSPILGLLWQTLLILTIPIKYDVLHALHDSTGHAIMGKWPI